jgi:hypothetical protein
MGREPEDLSGSEHVGRTQDAVRSEEADRGCVMNDDVDRVGEPVELQRRQPQRRRGEVASDRDDPRRFSLGQRREPGGAIRSVNASTELGLRAASPHHAVDGRGRGREQLAEQLAPEEAGGAGQQHRAVEAPGRTLRRHAEVVRQRDVPGDLRAQHVRPVTSSIPAAEPRRR